MRGRQTRRALRAKNKMAQRKNKATKTFHRACAPPTKERRVKKKKRQATTYVHFLYLSTLI